MQNIEKLRKNEVFISFTFSFKSLEEWVVTPILDSNGNIKDYHLNNIFHGDNSNDLNIVFRDKIFFNDYIKFINTYLTKPISQDRKLIVKYYEGMKDLLYNLLESYEGPELFMISYQVTSSISAEDFREYLYNNLKNNIILKESEIMNKNLGIEIKLLEKLEFGYNSIKDFYHNDESILVKVGKIKSGSHFERDIVIPVNINNYLSLEDTIMSMLKEIDVPHYIIEHLVLKLSDDKNYNFIKKALERLSKSQIMKHFPKAILTVIKKIGINEHSSDDIYFFHDTIYIRSYFITHIYTFPYDKVEHHHRTDVPSWPDNTFNVEKIEELDYLNDVINISDFEEEFSDLFEISIRYGKIVWDDGYIPQEEELYSFNVKKENIIEGIKGIKYSRKSLISPFVIKNNFVKYRESRDLPLQHFIEVHDSLPIEKMDILLSKYKIFDIEYPKVREELPIPKDISFLIHRIEEYFSYVITQESLKIFNLTFDVVYESSVPVLKLNIDCRNTNFKYDSSKRRSFLLHGYIKNNKIDYVTYETDEESSFYYVAHKEGLKEYIDKLLFNLFNIEVGGYKIRDILLGE